MAAALYEKLTSHCKVKSELEKVCSHIYAVGAFSSWNAEDDVFRDIQVQFNVSEIYEFKRVIINNQVIHSEAYDRATRRQSFTVLLFINGNLCPAKVRYFLKCKIGAQYLAVVQELRNRPDVTVNIGHITAVVPGGKRVIQIKSP